MSTDNGNHEVESYRINLEEAAEVREWTRCFRITERELHAAVQAVGPSVSRIRKYLSGDRS